MLIELLVLCVVLGLIYWLLQQLPIAPPFKNVVLVVFIIICILILVGFLPGVPYHSYYPRY